MNGTEKRSSTTERGMNVASKDYISTTDTAKMVRDALRRNFPRIKFSTRSKSYSGGSSITVSWSNGPSSQHVDAVIGRFAGASFDGMRDLKEYHSDILVASDGTMREVHFGADYVFTNRHTDPTLQAAVIARLASWWLESQWNAMPLYEHERLAWQAVCKLDDIPSDEPVGVTADRAASAFFGSVGVA